MKILKINEFNQKKDIESPIKSFNTHDTLQKDVWIDEKTINPKVRKNLLSIANDFYKDLDIDVKYKDIILIGSLCNYNYSQYADFDLHIVVDFSEVDENINLVEKYFYEVKVNWNFKHDIKIKGFDVEVFVQDVNVTPVASGVYSLMDDKWLITPNLFKGDIDKKGVASKAKYYMKEIEQVSDELETLDYETVNSRISKVWDKIKKGRQAGLETGGEMSVENLVFKLLRRNGYIEKLVDMKLKAYDKYRTIK